MTESTAMSDAKTRAWVTAFESEQPLYLQFPVRLMNGKSVPGIHVTCSCCNGRISGDRIRGRVVQSLAHVVTVCANGYCTECNRMTHIDCRFRVREHETVIEWLAANGQWQARELRQRTAVETITRGARRMMEWITKTK